MIDATNAHILPIQQAGVYDNVASSGHITDLSVYTLLHKVNVQANMSPVQDGTHNPQDTESPLSGFLATIPPSDDITDSKFGVSTFLTVPNKLVLERDLSYMK